MPSVPSKCLAIVAVIMMTACVSPNLPRNPTATESPPVTSPQPSTLATPTEQAPVIEQVITDLAARLGITPSEIKVVTQEAVTWPDKGLGCPQPGVNYIQIPVDGLRIVLNHSGTTYEYHTGASRWVLCETTLSKPTSAATPFQLKEVLTPEPILTSTLPIESGLQPAIEIAIADLANRLSIDRGSIEVVSAQSVVWPDRSLGCPQPGMVYLQVLVEGFQIKLRAKDQLYAYHGGEGHDPFLCENPAK